MVDVQNDFITGSLACSGSEEIVPVINGLVEDESLPFEGIFYSIDYHPENHCSYITNVGYTFFLISYSFFDLLRLIYRKSQ